MRFAVVTFGSEGDTRPLAALCRGLLDRGHELKLFAEHSTLSLPQRLGIQCEALAGDVKASLPIGDPGRDIRLSEVLHSIKALNSVVAVNTVAWMRAVAPYLRSADAILVSSLAASAGNALGKELQKPVIGLFFQPITPTCEFSSPMLPPMNLPGWAKRLTFRGVQRQTWKVCGKAAQAARLEVFGTRTTQRLSVDHPMLYGVSRALVAQPIDWPVDHCICGHWSRPVSGWEAPADLLEFLTAGEPPIYAGFGSPAGFIRHNAHCCTCRTSTSHLADRGRPFLLGTSRRARFNAASIATMIEFARREETREHARLLRERMSREDGVDTAIREIERILSTDEE